MDGEADLVGRFSDDLDIDERSIAGPVTSIADIGEGSGNKGKGPPRHAQDGNSTVSVLDISRLRLEDERPLVRVDHGLTLAAFHLLAGIIAARPAAFGRFHALAIENGSTW